MHDDTRRPLAASLADEFVDASRRYGGMVTLLDCAVDADLAGDAIRRLAPFGLPRPRDGSLVCYPDDNGTPIDRKIVLAAEAGDAAIADYIRLAGRAAGLFGIARSNVDVGAWSAALVAADPPVADFAPAGDGGDPLRDRVRIMLACPMEASARLLRRRFGDGRDADRPDDLAMSHADAVKMLGIPEAANPSRVMEQMRSAFVPGLLRCGKRAGKGPGYWYHPADVQRIVAARREVGPRPRRAEWHDPTPAEIELMKLEIRAARRGG